MTLSFVRRRERLESANIFRGRENPKDIDKYDIKCSFDCLQTYQSLLENIYKAGNNLEPRVLRLLGQRCKLWEAVWALQADVRFCVGQDGIDGKFIPPFI